jgi:hypothetical protein
MSRKIVNLVTPVVLDETKNVLNEYPKASCRSAFALPELHHKLIAYVLTRTPGIYAVVEEAEESVFNDKPVYCSVEHRQQIKTLICEGIEHILPESNSLHQSVSRDEELTSPTNLSSWFG